MIRIVSKHSNMKKRLRVYLSDIDKYRKPIPNPCNKVRELPMNNPEEEIVAMILHHHHQFWLT